MKVSSDQNRHARYLAITIIMICLHWQTLASESTICVETSLADVIDKIVILRIKQERIKDLEKLQNINKELELLCRTYQSCVHSSKELDELSVRLREVDKNLWDLEDAVRVKERKQSFDQEFVTTVDSILTNNDERACIKHSINLLSGSRIIEEKSYSHIKEVGIGHTRQKEFLEPVSLAIPIPLGDLADRITILLIKKELISDPVKHSNIMTEYEILEKTLHMAITPSAEFDPLLHDLLEANRTMWDIQDKLRTKKQGCQLDDEFIQLGRQVYYTNDRRCAIKRQINNLLGSQLVEEKDYARY